MHFQFLNQLLHHFDQKSNFQDAHFFQSNFLLNFETVSDIQFNFFDIV